MHLVQIGDEDVFWLDVSVNDVSLLQVGHRVDDLSDDDPTFLL